MIKLIQALIFLVFTWGFSQTKVNLKFQNPCNGLIEDVDFFLIKLDDFDLSYNSFDYETGFEIEPGTYSIIGSFSEGDYVKEFDIEKEFVANKIYTDTITLPQILRKRTSELHYPTDLGFYDCEKICNGLITEYHANGKIKMQAEFDNGYPTKKIFWYDKTGQLAKTDIYKRKGIFKRTVYAKNN
jgi:hypothetical protein